MLKRIQRKTRHIIYKIKKWVKDPPLDVLGSGVIGTMAGRTLLYGSFAASFIATGMYSYGLIFASVLLLDLFIHGEVLHSLRELMRYKVNEEIGNAYPIVYAP